MGTLRTNDSQYNSTDTESEIKYLVWEGEGVWSQSEVVGWEMSWEELSRQRWERSEGEDAG